MKTPKVTKVARVKREVNLASACNVSRSNYTPKTDGAFSGWATKVKGLNVR